MNTRHVRDKSGLDFKEPHQRTGSTITDNSINALLSRPARSPGVGRTTSVCVRVVCVRACACVRVGSTGLGKRGTLAEIDRARADGDRADGLPGT